MPGGDLVGWLEARSEAMAELLMRLVAVDTENPPGRALGRCAGLLIEAMESLGVAAERIGVAPSRELEEPCVVRGSVGDGPRSSTSKGTSTSCRRRAGPSSSPGAATAASSAAAPPT
jgi:acetylornithine deacetylase/succinyl-diaminopimelate desuccinylase-like protein